MARDNTQNNLPRFLTLAAVCVIVAALYFARDVLVPVALAVVLCFLLAPLVTRLERRKVPRAAAVTIVMVAVIGILGGLTWLVVAQISDLSDQLPKYDKNILAKVQAIRGRGSGTVDRILHTVHEVQDTAAGSTTDPATQQTLTAPERGASEQNPLFVKDVPDGGPFTALADYLGNLIGPLGTAGIVLVFVMFMLVEREDMRDRIIRLIGHGRLQLTTEALTDASTRVSKYLTAQAIVNGTYGIAISLGLCLIGFTLGDGWFPSFALWGLLCAILRFIPYIGPWIAATFPVALAIAVYPGYGVLVAVIALFVVIEVISNNVMEPVLYGASTGISTVAILVAAVFWTWLWGPIGLVLSTPLTVCIVVIGKHVPQFAFLDILLGDQPVLAPHERIYQRWLAMDQEEAAELAEDYLEKQTLEDVFDTVILPALAMAEQDRHAGGLDSDRWVFLRRAARDLIEELADQERIRANKQAADETVEQAAGGPPLDAKPKKDEPNLTPRAKLPNNCTVNIICLPAHDEADEIVGIMLSHLLRLRGYDATPISQNALASEMLDEVQKKEAQLVCISALPPSAVTHARYLCKRMTARFPTMEMVIGLWTVKGDLQRARQRIACSSKLALSTTLKDALDQINTLAQPLIIQNSNEKDADRKTASDAEKNGGKQPTLINR